MTIVETPMLDGALLVDIEELGVKRDSKEAESYAQFFWQPGTRWLLNRTGWRPATSQEMVMIRGWCKSLGGNAPDYWDVDEGPRLEDGELDEA